MSSPINKILVITYLREQKGANKVFSFLLVIVCNNELSFAHKKLIKIVSNMLFILFFSQDKKGDTWKDCNYLKKKKTTCTGSNSKLDKIPKMCMIKCY